MPIHFLSGEVVAYNSAWLLSAVLSGWCTYLLARTWGASAFPSLLAGLLVEFSPYRLSQALGHFGAMQLWWIPATLLAMTLWFRTRAMGWGIVSGVLIVGTAWTEHQLFLSLTLTLAILGMWSWRNILLHLRLAPVSVFIFALLVALGAVLPFLPTLQHVSSPDTFFNLGQEQRERFSARLETLFLPAPFHLFREGAVGYGTDSSSAADHVHTIGFFLPLVVIATLIPSPRSRKEWMLVTVALVGLLIALGPVLHVGRFELPLPAALMDRVPLLSALRTLGRFVNLPVIALPLLVALRWPMLPRVRFLRFVLAAFLLLEVLPSPSIPRTPVDTDIVQPLADVPEGALLVVSSSTNYRLASEHLYLSALHGHELVGNSALERATDPATQERFLATPVVRDLALLRLADLALPTFFGQELRDIAPAAFASQNIRAVVYDTNPPGGVVSLDGTQRHELSETERASVRLFLRETLRLPEEQLEDHVYLYRVPEPTPSATPVVAMRGRGWKLLRRSATKLSTELSERASMALFATRSPSFAVTLFAEVSERGGARILTITGPEGEAVAAIPPSGTIAIPLGVPPPGVSSYALHVDVSGLILENPRIHVP